jgi:ABC exporter DevB family membrane fusion protein
MLRILLISSGVASVVMLGGWIDVQSRSPAVRPAPESRPTIAAVGRIEGRTGEIALRPQLAGRVTRVLVREGQTVAAGDVLVQLDDGQYRQEVALAAAEVELAEAQLQRLVNGARREQRAEAAALYRARQVELEQAQLTWRRIESLGRDGAVSKQQTENQQAAVQVLANEVEAARARVALVEAPARPEEVRMEKAHVRAAEARLELARVQLDRACLRAPAAGEILKVTLEPGELAGPTSAEAAVVMVDTTRRYVRAYVEEMDASRVQIGMPAKITAAGLLGRQFTGHVARLSPRMDRKQIWSDEPAERFDTKTREVWIELEQGTELVLGLRVDVVIGSN